jgi:HAD superfamily hydrolase (TIGR01490 family)
MKSGVCAFFDVDGTLINFNSMISFLSYSLTAYYGSHEGTQRLNKYYSIAQEIDILNNRQELNRLYYRNFEGIEKFCIQTISEKWFKAIFNDNEIFNEKCLAKLEYHQNNNHKVVFVSGGFFGNLDLLAQKLNVEHVLCVQPIVSDEVLTGEIDLTKQTIGIGKAIAIRAFVQQHYLDNTNLSSCYAYGDHISDIDMLSAVGNPVVVGNDKAMLEYAKLNKWSML